MVNNIGLNFQTLTNILVSCLKLTPGKSTKITPYKCIQLKFLFVIIETRPCLTNPCMHGGRCIDSFSGFHWSFGPMQYYCVCKRPFKGLNCERKSGLFIFLSLVNTKNCFGVYLTSKTFCV